ncbi:hypothetical protein ACIQXD_34775 [Streptomyces uncialis]|uniref:hypothetical protein n=1 Tax=Streptomyces uncialis TaxID=1048205 RepID=UPI00382C30D5
MVAHDRYAQMPSLLAGGSSPVFLMQMTPLIVTSALAYCLAQGVPEIEATTLRKVRVLDAALATVLVAVVVLVSLSTGIVADSQEATMTGRNTLFLTGLMLLARSLHDQAASAVPVGWVFAVMFAGYRDFHRPWPWAVTLHPANYVPTLALCLLVFGTGLAVHIRTRRT